MKEEFDYESYWNQNSQEEKEAQEKIKNFSKGQPRKGIKGKYIKKKNNITKRMIKNSYLSIKSTDH